MTSQGQDRLSPAKERPLRVAIISGEGHLDFDLAFTASVAQHAEVLFCGPSSIPPEDISGLALSKVLLAPWPRHRSILGNFKLVAQIWGAVRRFSPDVVHVLSEGQVWFNVLPTLLWPSPIIVTVHDVRMHPGDQDTARVPRRLVDLFIAQAKAVIVHGEALREDAVKHLGLKANRVFLGVHPVLLKYADLAKANDLVHPDDGVFRILFFGRIFPYKGVDHLIAAEPLISDAVSPRLTIIAGRGEPVADKVKASKAPQRFDVRARAIPDEEAATLFAHADLVVLPYVEASQSGVLAIAAGCGRPVIASDVGDMGALVSKTGMGLLVPPADPAALAAAIDRVAQDRRLRDALAAKSVEAAKTTLGPEAVWRHAETAYRAVLRR